MKKFNRLIGTAAALLFTFTACNNSFSPQSSDSSAQGQAAEALATPLTLEACDAGAVVTFDNKAAGPVTYKVNGGEAQTIASDAKGTITLAKVGDKVEFFGDNNAYSFEPGEEYANYKCSKIACDKDCYVYGNIMSLIKSKDFKDVKILEKKMTFSKLFLSNTHIKNKSGADLLLPATTLADSCYSYMFSGCTSLTAAPSLPATTLANLCYENMFYGCTSLTAAPDLPATTLAFCCYSGMFSGCTSLTAAPDLPATTLAFCCYSGMFSGCTSLTAAPELKAATLADSCYSGMFSGCTSLASVTCLATDISASGCTTNWLYGVASTGTFKKADGMTSWPTNSASGIPSGWTYNGGVSYSPEALATPLTLEAAKAGAVVTFVNKASGPVTYKVNGGAAQTIAKNSTGTITLAAIGDKVEFFGDNKAYATDTSNYSNIACDKDCYVYGNIMSLVNSAHFEKATALEEYYTFTCLFRNNTHIKNKDGADLLLPATTLEYSCYLAMFQGCASLTAAPSLPATTLATWCYHSMFQGCTSLTAAPSLPATTLAISCYYAMFQDCASLTAAPSLPAAMLANSCYYAMFQGCASLTAAPSLPATTLAHSCYHTMFQGCASLTAAPSLPAATLADYCYVGMFYGCTRLTSVTCLATNISAINCTTNWLVGVAASGTFTKAASADWSGKTGADGIPSGWTVNNK